MPRSARAWSCQKPSTRKYWLQDWNQRWRMLKASMLKDRNHTPWRKNVIWNRNRNNATPQLEGLKDFLTKSQRSLVPLFYLRLWGPCSPWDLEIFDLSGSEAETDHHLLTHQGWMPRLKSCAFWRANMIYTNLKIYCTLFIPHHM